QLQEQVNKAKEAYENAKNLAGQYSHLHLQRDELCRQIKNLLNNLILWCNNNPDLCTSKDQLERFLETCPEKPIQAEQFWRDFNNLIASKKGVEQQHRREATQHRRDAAEYRRQARQNSDDITAAETALAELARRRRELENQRIEAKRRAVQQRLEAERLRQQREKEERDNCVKMFAEWIARNQQYLDDDDLDKLKPIVEGMQATAEVGADIAQGLASGATTTGATLSGVASGLINLGASIFYGWVQSAATSAFKKIGNNHILNLLDAYLAGDNRKCGVIDPKGATSFFFFRQGDKLLVFRISATHGFEFLGVK
ncbi:hypothetical protein KA005_35485, partial [bacterium]|nr:hypothetical protein [bacterium]